MQYLILIYDREGQGDASEASADQLQPWRDLTASMKEAGVWVGGEALQPVTTATTVRKGDGGLMTLDGPFAETKEQLGGFYLIDVKDLDEALHWARQMPHLGSGSAEVRPIWPFPEE